jgi:type IV pilus assembly protein PilO
MPTSQRDQAMLLVGIVGIVGAVAYWNFVYAPKALAIEESRTRVEALEAANRRAKTVVARGSVDEVSREAEQAQQSLEVIRTLIPTGNEVPALLDQINVAARRAGLQFSNFAPGPTTEGAQFDTYQFRMSVQGTYHQIGALLSAIGGLPRIIVPANLTLAEAPATAGSAASAEPARPDQRLLVATFDIQTYVSKQAAPAQGGGAR